MALTEQQILNATEPVVYIARREGVICAAWSQSHPDATEALYESDEEVQAFRSRPMPEQTPAQRLAATTGLTVTQLKALVAGGK